MRRITLLTVGALFLIGFALLSKYEDRSFLRNLDYAVTVKAQDRIDKSSHLRTAALVGNLMEGATFFASPGFTVIIVLLGTLYASYDRKRKRINVGAASIPIMLAVLVLVEVVGKSLVHHPSPPFGMIKNPVSLFPADYVNEQYSYPSGHAARAVFMALIIFGIWASGRGKLGRLVLSATLVFFIVTVSVSRIYLGHHWFSDVIGGLFVGLGTGCIAVAMLLPNRRGSHARVPVTSTHAIPKDDS